MVYVTSIDSDRGEKTVSSTGDVSSEESVVRKDKTMMSAVDSEKSKSKSSIDTRTYTADGTDTESRIGEERSDITNDDGKIIVNSASDKVAEGVVSGASAEKRPLVDSSTSSGSVESDYVAMVSETNDENTDSTVSSDPNASEPAERDVVPSSSVDTHENPVAGNPNDSIPDDSVGSKRVDITAEYSREGTTTVLCSGNEPNGPAPLYAQPLTP